MKRSFRTVTMAIFILFLLTACSKGDNINYISEKVGIGLSKEDMVLEYNTKSGNGDGILYLVFDVSSKGIEEKIENRSGWKKLPFDYTTKTLVYGIDENNVSSGPYITGEDGEKLFPEINEGYYKLTDENKDEDGNLLDGGYMNIEIIVYDSISNKLYFCRFDT